MFSAVFKHEWLLFRRQKTGIAALIFFILTGLLSIRTGYRTILLQSVQADSIRQAYQVDFNNALARFNDTATPAKKVQAMYAGLAEIVSFRLPQNTFLVPRPLAMLSIGQADIQPFSQQVKTNIDFTAPPNTPVSNPSKLFAGNFDLSFVLIFLLPLFVIAFCYPVYALEKEAGTLTLLMVQGAGVQRIMIYKLLFRVLIFTIVLMLLNLAGFLSASLLQTITLTEIITWSLCSFLYLLVWFAIAYLVISFKRPASVTAMSMAGIWLLLLIIIPAGINMYLSMLYPIPLRDGLASYDRHTGEEVWASPPGLLADSFYHYNPQYAGFKDPAKDSLRSGKVFSIGYYDLKERKVKRMADLFNREVAKHNLAATRLSAWDPPLLLQAAFNAMAGTDRESYVRFNTSVERFRRAWRAFLYQYQLRDIKLKPSDFYTFPVFDTKREPVRLINHLPAMMILLGTTILITLWGHFTFKRSAI